MRADSGVSPATQSSGRPSFREAFAVWLKIGLLGFGGPAGQIALMHRMVVQERNWIGEPQFLHALNFCMLLPGPEAQQLATYVGWLLHGVKGGVAAGVLFVLPGFLILVALSIAYVTLGDFAVVQGILYGLKAAVLALVLEALVRIAGRALQRRALVYLSIAAFVAIAFLGMPFPLLIALAAVAGLLFLPAADGPAVPVPSSPGAAGSTAAHILVWGAIWLAPLALLAAALGPQNVFATIGFFFSKVAVVTFGGAYAVLAYVAQQAVETYRWLTPDEMLTGLGLAETTPGPLILVLVFVGFLAGFRGETGLDPLLAGTVGASITAWMIFAPSFLFIFAGAPHVERLRGNRMLAGALAAVTAAVVGVIANLALWFGLHMLFAEVHEMTVGPLDLPAPDVSTFDVAAASIALLAGVALLRLRVGVPLVLAVAALAGVAVHLGA